MTIKPTIAVSFTNRKEIDWKVEALNVRAELLVCQQRLSDAREQLDGIELRLRERAALISITREGRKLHFTFVRNGSPYRVTCMGTWSDDVDGWKKELLQ